MAHKKGGGSTRNGRDSNSQRLGIKRFGGQVVKGGTIIVRQRGTKIHPGNNACGGDDTLFTKIDGVITFERLDKKKKQDSVYPVAVKNRCRPVSDRVLSHSCAIRRFKR